MKELDSGKTTKLLPKYPGRFQYYPSIDQNERFLLCSVSPSVSIFRRAAAYEIVAVELATGRIQPIDTRIQNCRLARWLKD